MRKLLFAVGFLAVAFALSAGRARADVQALPSGPIVLSAANASVTLTGLTGQSNFGVSVTQTSGVWTLVAECTRNAQTDPAINWSSPLLYTDTGVSSSSIAASSFSGAFSCASPQQVRIRMATWSSGSATVSVFGTGALGATIIPNFPPAYNTDSHGNLQTTLLDVAGVNQAGIDSNHNVLTKTCNGTNCAAVDANGNLFANPDQSGSNTSLSVTTTSCPAACVMLTLANGEGLAFFKVQGLTPTGATGVFERSSDNIAWGAAPSFLSASTGTTPQSSAGITGSGSYLVDVSGYHYVRFRVSVAGTGTIAVYYFASSLPGFLSQPLGSNTTLQQDASNNLKTSTQVTNGTGTGSNYTFSYPDAPVAWTAALTAGTTTEIIAGVANETIYLYWAGVESTGSNFAATMNFAVGTGSTCAGSRVLLAPTAVGITSWSAGQLVPMFSGSSDTPVTMIVPAAVPIAIPSGSTAVNVCIIPTGTTLAAKGGAVYSIH